MMYDSGLLVLLILIAQTPVLLVLAVGFFLILNKAPPGKVRVLGTAGLAIALGSRLVGGVVMSWLSTVVLDGWTFSYGTMFPMLHVARFMFELFEALGYGLLITALARALRQVYAVPPPTR